MSAAFLRLTSVALILTLALSPSLAAAKNRKSSQVSKRSSAGKSSSSDIRSPLPRGSYEQCEICGQFRDHCTGCYLPNMEENYMTNNILPLILCSPTEDSCWDYLYNKFFNYSFCADNALLSNFNGVLLCSDYKSFVPGGDWKKTCTPVTMNGKTLVARCRRDGRIKSSPDNQSSLDMADCADGVKAEVSNCNGALCCRLKTRTAKPPTLPSNVKNSSNSSKSANSLMSWCNATNATVGHCVTCFSGKTDAIFPASKCALIPSSISETFLTSLPLGIPYANAAAGIDTSYWCGFDSNKSWICYACFGAPFPFPKDVCPAK